MPDYRCPVDDRVFESFTDHRKPGSQATATLPAHPLNGHPDCPKCIERMKASPDRNQQLAIARARAANAAARVREAQAEAEAASNAVYDAAEAEPPAASGRRVSF